MSKTWLTALPGAIRLVLQISANAKKTEVIGVVGDALKLRLHAAPVEGKANLALIRYLSDTLAVPRSAITLTQGHASQRKMLEIASPDLTPEAVMKLLLGGVKI